MKVHALPLAILGLTLAGCDSFYGVGGRVVSCADKRPLTGALVHLESSTRRGDQVTATDGSYKIWLNEPDGDGPSRLTVAKPGFRTMEHDVVDPHVDQDVCLQSEVSSERPTSP
jgi:hypothetical protein